MKKDYSPAFSGLIGLILVMTYLVIVCQSDYVPMNSKYIVSPDSLVKKARPTIEKPFKETMP